MAVYLVTREFDGLSTLRACCEPRRDDVIVLLAEQTPASLRQALTAQVLGAWSQPVSAPASLLPQHDLRVITAAELVELIASNGPVITWGQ